MPDIATAAAALLGQRCTAQPLAAGGFTRTWRIHFSDGRLAFAKTLPAGSLDVLQAEADGLGALHAAGCVGVPQVLACAADGVTGQALLVMDWLELQAPGPGFGARLGQALGQLHRRAPPEGEGRYGWRRDNLLGSTPQSNRWSAGGGLAGWLTFFAEERLGALAARLKDAGGQDDLAQAVETLAERLPTFFDDGHVPRASLIHGDLWSGNWGCVAGEPVLYDPAVSCSDAEAELAMMELFGRPPDGFWPAYREAAGLHAGYARRRGLYQLHHLLNHALIFGGGYAGQALTLARRLLDQA